MILRPHQITLTDAVRDALFVDHLSAVCVQAPTGTGKTAFAVSILSSLNINKKIAWFITPRNELVNQASEHLTRWNTAHGRITANSRESLAYNVHVVSKETITRRWNKIKRPPDYAFIDESHINLDFQIEFRERFPDTKIIGMTATPERLDTRGLSVHGGGIYERLIESESIPWFTERGYLTPLRYYSPPLTGLDAIHRRGTEYDAGELHQLFERNRIYGEAIEHYRRFADGRPALVFCRDVKSAYETADRFSRAGYKYFCIESGTGAKERRVLIDALKNGEINGLTNCEIATYGLDIPRVEVGICLRPTLSRALYMQFIGRILRPFPGKSDALFFDHVNNVEEHCQSRTLDGVPVPLHYEEKIIWNFDGRERHRREEPEEKPMSLWYCVNCCLYVSGTVCPSCGAGHITRKRKPQETISTELRELKPVPLSERAPEERREIQDRISSAVECGAVKDMLEIADNLGYAPEWAYWKLVRENRQSVDVSLLHEIARVKGYKPGWAYFKAKQLRRDKNEYREAMG